MWCHYPCCCSSCLDERWHDCQEKDLVGNLETMVEPGFSLNKMNTLDSEEQVSLITYPISISHKNNFIFSTIMIFYNSREVAVRKEVVNSNLKTKFLSLQLLQGKLASDLHLVREVQVRRNRFEYIL